MKIRRIRHREITVLELAQLPKKGWYLGEDEIISVNRQEGTLRLYFDPAWSDPPRRIHSTEHRWVLKKG